MIVGRDGRPEADVICPRAGPEYSFEIAGSRRRVGT